MPTPAFFSTASFPPLSFFVLLVKHRKAYIDENEYYAKQSYRNRYEILAPGGKQALSIPVQKISGSKQLIKDIRIDYKNDWQSQQLKSLHSAYLSSPFFVHYIDALKPFFSRRYPFLFDFNLQIINTLLSETFLSNQVHILPGKPEETKPYADYRSLIHPKRKEEFPTDILPTYTQVFAQKHPFQSNLSLLDLLFNEGPNTENLLKQAAQKNISL